MTTVINAASHPPNDNRRVLAWDGGSWEIWWFDQDVREWLGAETCSGDDPPSHWTELPPEPSG